MPPRHFGWLLAEADEKRSGALSRDDKDELLRMYREAKEEWQKSSATS